MNDYYDSLIPNDSETDIPWWCVAGAVIFTLMGLTLYGIIMAYCWSLGLVYKVRYWQVRKNHIVFL